MKIIVFLLFVFINSSIFSQTIAVTEKGDSVLLYNNGTWEYLTEYSILSDSAEVVLDTNLTSFSKPNSSKKLLKGQKIDYKLWYNNKVWRLAENETPHIEYLLTNSNEEIYCMSIPERVAMPMATLKEIALSNAKSAGSGFKILEEEVRIVNGKPVNMMVFQATVDGITFKYMGYYFAEEVGTMQLLTFTYKNLFDEYRDELEKILNGLVF